jgi:hypothetical protein
MSGRTTDRVDIPSIAGITQFFGRSNYRRRDMPSKGPFSGIEPCSNLKQSLQDLQGRDSGGHYYCGRLFALLAVPQVQI